MKTLNPRAGVLVQPAGPMGAMPAPSTSPARRPVTVKVRRNPLLRLPIATQLTLGFLIAAMIAAVGAGLVGLQRADSLNKQSNFYQSLLRANTFLTNGNNLLQLMNTKRGQTVTDATATKPAQETLDGDQLSLTNLGQLYDTIISSYVGSQLAIQHPDEVALLAEGNHSDQQRIQQSLALSALRTWKQYQSVQAQFLSDIASKDTTNATILDRVAGEPLNADATSALRALIRFDSKLATSISDAADVEQQNLTIATAAAAVIAFFFIALVGWFISSGIVRRLSQLRRVTQAVEDGEVDARVNVVGRDELAEVSASVNGMLDTIVGLLEETRRQRDALTNAADRLFSDMRVAGAGDLRVNATVSNDPIGMLGNAFNLTVGRFRRFLMRTQTTIEQLDAISRRETSHAQSFYLYMQQARQMPPQLPPSGSAIWDDNNMAAGGMNAALAGPVSRARELVYYVAQEGPSAHLRIVLEAAEEAYLSSTRLNQLVTALPEARSPNTVVHLAQLQAQELQVLESALRKLGNEAYAAQRNAATGLNELNATLEQISHASRGTASRTPSSPMQVSANDVAVAAGGFAQEICELSGELLGIIQELRSGIAPFRIDANENDGMIMPGNYQPQQQANYR